MTVNENSFFKTLRSDGFGRRAIQALQARFQGLESGGSSPVEWAQIQGGDLSGITGSAGENTSLLPLALSGHSAGSPTVSDTDIVIDPTHAYHLDVVINATTAGSGAVAVNVNGNFDDAYPRIFAAGSVQVRYTGTVQGVAAINLSLFSDAGISAVGNVAVSVYDLGLLAVGV